MAVMSPFAALVAAAARWAARVAVGASPDLADDTPAGGASRLLLRPDALDAGTAGARSARCCWRAHSAAPRGLLPVLAFRACNGRTLLNQWQSLCDLELV